MCFSIPDHFVIESEHLADDVYMTHATVFDSNGEEIGKTVPFCGDLDESRKATWYSARNQYGKIPEREGWTP